MENPTRFETLRIARELIIDEYIEKKAQIHRKWQAESEQLWRARRETLPYPDYPPYPTEDEIMDRARKLQEFLEHTTKEPVSEEPKEIAMDCEPGNVMPGNTEPMISCEPGNVAPGNTEPQVSCEPAGNVEPPANASPVFSTVGRFDIDPKSDIDIARMRIARRRDDDTTTAERLLPDLIKKLEEIRTGPTNL